MAVPARVLPAPSPPAKRRTAPARRASPPPRKARQQTAAGGRPRARGKPRPRRAGFTLLTLVVLGILVVLLVSTQAMVSQSAFRLNDLSRRANELETEYGRLRLRVAELSSPARVAEAARQAGLVPPEPHQVEVLGVRGDRHRREAPGGGVGEAVAFPGPPGSLLPVGGGG